MKDTDRLFGVLEELSCSLDEDLAWLKNNDRSDESKNIKDLWEKTYKSRLDELLENKKNVKKDYYLAFKCLESSEGTSLVSFNKFKNIDFAKVTILIFFQRSWSTILISNIHLQKTYFNFSGRLSLKKLFCLLTKSRSQMPHVLIVLRSMF